MSFDASSQARAFVHVPRLFLPRVVFKDLISPLPCSHSRRLGYQRLIGAVSGGPRPYGSNTEKPDVEFIPTRRLDAPTQPRVASAA
jgi:hypothetical protein